jgi:cell division protein FtsI/penicillin-binding protein 2/cell division protein FtsW (lipid II flippase)
VKSPRRSSVDRVRWSSDRSAAVTEHARLAGLDPVLIVSLAVLGALGVVNLVSLGDTQQALHQAATLIAGGCALVLACRTRTQQWRFLGIAVYAVAVLLLMVLAAAGTHAYGAQRWLALGALQFQPSEVAKLGLLLVLAGTLASARSHRLLVGLGLVALPVALTLVEPDLSTSLLLVLIAAAMLVLARIRLRSLAAIVLLLGALAPLALHLLRPYQMARLSDFLSGGSGEQSWTVLQAHIAVASGGLLGAGSSLPHGLLAQYLPTRETDLAFASLIEQRGLVAGICALLAGAVVVWRLAAAARRTRTRAGSLLATGLAVLFGAEISLNVGGNLGLLPFAGVPFPLLSSGGTAVVVHCVAVGVVMGERREGEQRRLWCPPQWARPRPRFGRLGALAVVLMLGALALSTYDLQRRQGAELQQAGLGEVSRLIVIPGGRGNIEDRHGDVLATDRLVQQVLAVPAVVEAAGADVRLASLLGEPRAQLDRSLAGSPPYGGFDVALADAVPDAVAARVRAAAIPGVIVAPTVLRSYPYGSALAPLLGFVGVATPVDVKRLGPLPPDQIVGRAGLELQYDRLLTGAQGSQDLIVDPAGNPVAMGPYRAPTAGGELRLSIDLDLQEQATALLDTALRGTGVGQQRGDQGSVVVMDVHTGEVLAMASSPAYDDNAFGPPVNNALLNQEISAAGNPFLEHATQTAMPPGSTFKLVVAAADLATGAVPPSRVVPTGSTFNYDGFTYVNWADLPAQNLSQALAWSNDVYFYKLALALGPQRIAAVAGQLGVGQPTGIDLPGESSGFLGTPSSVAAAGLPWYPGSTVDLGIGQGYVTATPLQDVRWTAALASGSLVTPRLGLAARPAGQAAFIPLPGQLPQPLPFAASLGPLQQGLRGSVDSGTGTLLAGLPVPAAGKTGTAQDPSAPGGGPDAWYSAYTPASSPEIAITVSVRGGGEGFYTAEPLVRDLLTYFDAHEQQVMAAAPSTPSPVSAAAATAVSGHAPAGALALPVMLLSWRRRRRPRRAWPGPWRRPQRHTSAGAPQAGPRNRTSLQGGARSRRVANHLQKPRCPPA